METLYFNLCKTLSILKVLFNTNEIITPIWILLVGHLRHHIWTELGGEINKTHDKSGIKIKSQDLG